MCEIYLTVLVSFPIFRKSEKEDQSDLTSLARGEIPRQLSFFSFQVVFLPSARRRRKRESSLTGERGRQPPLPPSELSDRRERRRKEGGRGGRGRGDFSSDCQAWNGVCLRVELGGANRGRKGGEESSLTFNPRRKRFTLQEVAKANLPKNN